MRKLLQRYIGTIGLLLAIVGAGLLAASTNVGVAVIANLLANLGSTLVGTGLLTLIYRLYVADILESKELDESGLAAFRMRRADLFAEVDLAEMMRDSNAINVMGITVASIVEELGNNAITVLAARGSRFTFLLMNPNSPLVRAREQQENRPERYLSDRIETSIASVRLIRQELAPELRARIVLKMYDYDYSASLVLGDEKAVFQPYLEGEDANHSAVFVYHSTSGGMYARLRKHFTAVEKRSSDITTPTILITFGHTCAGKTALSRRIAREFDFPVLATYEFRQRLHPLLTSPADYRLNNPRYRNTAEDVYREVTRELNSRLVRVPRGIIIDGSFPFVRWRVPIYEVAKQFGARVVILDCRCSNQDEVARRLEVRANDPSLLPTERARDIDVYLSSIQDVEPVDPKEWNAHGIEVTVMMYDTSTDPLATFDRVPEPLRSQLGELVGTPKVEWIIRR